MKNKQIENMLRKEADQYVPDNRQDVLGRVYLNKYKQEAKKPRRRFWLVLAPIATVLVLAITLTAVFLPKTGGGGSSIIGGGGGSGGEGVTPPPAVFSESIVRVNINPSVKFNVNEAGMVTKQTPCNKDGAVMLMQRNFVGIQADTATSEIVKLAVKYGYLTNTKGRNVDLKVLNTDTSKEEALESKLVQIVELAVKSIAPEVQVRSNGRAEMIEYLVDKHNYSQKEAEKLSAEELEDVCEDLMDEDSDEELEQYTAELQKGMKTYLEGRARDGAKIVTMLEGYLSGVAGEDEDASVVISEPDRNKIVAFIADYSVEMSDEKLTNPTKSGLEEVVEELKKEQTEITTVLAELKEGKPEVSEQLEDWFDTYKKHLKKNPK